MKIIYSLLVTLALVSCQNQGKSNEQLAKQATIDSMKVVMQKQQVIDSMRGEIASNRQIERIKTHTYNNTTTSENAATQPVAQKKGWSGAAKGAVIGAGVGAATGAISSKKKGEGAIIGGLVGAGVGAGTGAIIDDSKKNKE